MPLPTKCAYCGASRGAYVWHGDKMVRVKLVTVRDRGGTLVLCEACADNHNKDQSALPKVKQLRLFED